MGSHRDRSLIPRGRSWPKTAGLALLVVPLGFLGLFTVGEVAGGDAGGLSHAVQALPLIVVAAAAYRWPLQAGCVLIAGGLAIVIAYALVASSRFEATTIAIVEAVLALPVVSGALLVLAGLPGDGSRGSRQS
jgi:hypothetical protein